MHLPTNRPGLSAVIGLKTPTPSRNRPSGPNPVRSIHRPSSHLPSPVRFHERLRSGRSRPSGAPFRRRTKSHTKAWRKPDIRPAFHVRQLLPVYHKSSCCCNILSKCYTSLQISEQNARIRKLEEELGKGDEGVADSPLEFYDGILISDHEAALIKHGFQNQECMAHIKRYIINSMEIEKGLTCNAKPRSQYLRGFSLSVRP